MAASTDFPLLVSFVYGVRYATILKRPFRIPSASFLRAKICHFRKLHDQVVSLENRLPRKTKDRKETLSPGVRRGWEETEAQSSSVR